MEVDGADGIDEDEGGEASTDGVESGVADAVVGGKAGNGNSGDCTVAQEGVEERIGGVAAGWVANGEARVAVLATRSLADDLAGNTQVGVELGAPSVPHAVDRPDTAILGEVGCVGGMPVLRVGDAGPGGPGLCDGVIDGRDDRVATGDGQAALGVGEVVLDIDDDEGGAFVPADHSRATLGRRGARVKYAAMGGAGRLARVSDTWQPEQYARFRAEREQPFHDLLALVEPVPGGRVVDLGCGTGVLTRVLHEHTQAAETVGVDRSEPMLAQSAQHAGGGVRFERGDIEAFAGKGLDVVFSNAALQWVDGHEALFPRLAATLREGGQLAVQMPMNHDHPAHTVAHEVARQPRHAKALGGYVRGYPLREVEWYAELVARMGFEEQHVRLQVYLHRLAGPEEVVEWVKGSLLTDYRNRLSPEEYEAYLSDFRERLLAELPDERPHL